jgi:hypothetical protein
VTDAAEDEYHHDRLPDVVEREVEGWNGDARYQRARYRERERNTQDFADTGNYHQLAVTMCVAAAAADA